MGEDFEKQTTSPSTPSKVQLTPEERKVGAKDEPSAKLTIKGEDRAPEDNSYTGQNDLFCKLMGSAVHVISLLRVGICMRLVFGSNWTNLPWDGGWKRATSCSLG